MQSKYLVKSGSSVIKHQLVFLFSLLYTLEVGRAFATSIAHVNVAVRMSATYRRLVVLLDGTWQELTDRTNVALLKENLYTGTTGDQIEQIVGYFEGVGASNNANRIFAGAFGYGLSETIKESYLWLSQTYKPGDEVYIFGFSRGAYSARSLVGLMDKCGGVVKQPTEALIDEAYDLYRDTDSDATQFTAKHSQSARVRLLGVWDTVGSLGIPVSGLPWCSPARETSTGSMTQSCRALWMSLPRAGDRRVPRRFSADSLGRDHGDEQSRGAMLVHRRSWQHRWWRSHEHALETALRLDARQSHRRRLALEAHHGR